MFGKTSPAANLMQELVDTKHMQIVDSEFEANLKQMVTSDEYFLIEYRTVSHCREPETADQETTDNKEV